MTDPDTISADYTLRPAELAEALSLLARSRQPVMVWGPPGCGKSQIAQQVAGQDGYRYVDIRALLLDPVDLRGIPWRDEHGRTRWAPPAFLPPTDSTARWLLNLEELASCVPMVQAALYQLTLERKYGEYELPEGASIIACGNRENDRVVVHRMPTPLANRFVHDFFGDYIPNLKPLLRSQAQKAPHFAARTIPTGCLSCGFLGLPPFVIES